MIKRQVWRETDIDKIPSNRRLIGSKWVFKKKRNGVYRARLVGLGYSQIPGVDNKDELLTCGLRHNLQMCDGFSFIE